MPVFRGGGLAICGTTLLGLWGLALVGVFVSDWTVLAAYTAASVLVAATSFVDDMRSLPWWMRMTAQVAAAAIVVAGIGFWRVIDLPGLSGVAIGGAGVALTVIWVVGFTNAYNFMDGVDGLAGTQGLLSGLGWSLVGLWVESPAPVVIGLLVSGSCLGFLRSNWSPARVFMGDVGSAFLGFTLAVLPLLCFESVQPRLLLAAVLMTWPFVLDTTFTLMRRLARGENIVQAHRSHLYQRLMLTGHSHGSVTKLYMVFMAAGVGLACLWVKEVPGSSWIVTTVVTVGSLGLWVFIVRREARPTASASGTPDVLQSRPG